jgi:hypothetical protein
MKKIYSLLSILSALLISCGDDNPTDNNGNKNYMPLTNGNYWIYESKMVDTLGNIDESVSYTDSSAITGTETKDGELATVLTNYRFENNSWVEVSKEHLYNKNNKTYIYSDYLTKMNFMGVQLDLGIEGQWLVYIDNSSDSWTLLNNAQIDTVEMNLQGMPLKVAGTLTITAKKLANETVNAQGKNYDAGKFEYKAVLSGSAFYQGFPIPVTSTLIRTYWFADEVGVVKQRTDPGIFNATFLNTKIPGETSILTKSQLSN